MRKAIKRGLRSGVVGAAILALSIGGCDWIETTSVNPNAVPTATLDQLFTGIQVNNYFYSEGQLSRIAAVWTQQMTGTDRQFAALNEYVHNEQSADGEFNTIYTGGGLVDLDDAIPAAEEAGRRVYAGILKIHQAYMFGMAASVWGDIPYSEATNPDIEEPVLDDQAAVYASIQSLLDEAIADIQSGQGAGPGGIDLSLGGNADAWVDVAHTLKARYHLHWVEVEGDSRYQAALDAAQDGITDAAHNWMAIHTEASAESNFWFQFERERSGYISAGNALLPVMRDKNDDRLPLYYTGPPFVTPEEGGQVSVISETGFGNPAFDFPLVTCWENLFIVAEAQYQLGNEGLARDAAIDAVECNAAALGVDLADQVTLLQAATGADLFEEIMEQKWAAQFLNIDAWNDYKRTCLPTLTPTVPGETIPGRLFYSQAERQSNSNVPEPAEQPTRNDNDPSACS